MSGTSPLPRIIAALAFLWFGRVGILVGGPLDSTISQVLFITLLGLDGFILAASGFYTARVIGQNQGTLWYWLLLLSVCIVVVASANYWANAFSDRSMRPPNQVQAPPVLEMRGSVAFWDGSIDFDSFEALKNTLELHPHIETLSLDSAGGRIAAARGMARLVSEAKLNTSANGICASACTLVFIAGTTRKLAPEGQLGFHGYKLLSGIQTIDTQAEQLRDRDMFLRRGVDADFLDRAFSVPFEKIWFPDFKTLRSSGILTD